ncbi:amidase domain-containing protein [Streptomyces sp. NPDC020096]
MKQELRGTGGKFDRVKLVQFALDNWNKPDETDLGNNCTNFVSEAMMHAGVHQKTDFWWGTKGDDVWMRGNPIGIDLIDKHLAYSSTWGAADNLQGFLTKCGSYEVPASQAKPGDIIFLNQVGANDDDRPYGKAHHAAIVTAVMPDGEIKYTQHTDSYQNVSLQGRTPAEVRKEGQQDFRIIRIQPDWY